MDYYDYIDLTEDFLMQMNVQVRVKSNEYISLTECPYCHNGKSNRPRAFILLQSDNDPMFVCHNDDCRESHNIGLMAKYNDRSDLFNKFLMFKRKQSFGYEEVKFESGYIDAETPEDDYNNINLPGKLDLESSMGNKFSLNITSELPEIAKNYLDGRCIKDHSKFMYNPNSQRLVIPYKNRNDNTYYYFQERSIPGLREYSDKYWFPPVNKNFKLKKIYNLYNVKKTKDVVMVEGMFDSLFIENAISVGGLNMNIINNVMDFHKLDKVLFLQDNDKAGIFFVNKIINNNRKSFDAKDIYTFMWKKFLKDLGFAPGEMSKIKDINDLYLGGHLTERLRLKDIKQYFSNKETTMKLFV